MTESEKPETKKTVIENGIEYIEKEDGLFYPNFDMNEEEEDEDKIDTGMGKIWLRFMREEYPGRVAELQIRGELYQTMKWIEKEAWEMVYATEKAYLANHPAIPGDYLDTVEKMMQARDCAMEIMQKEFLYRYH